MSLIYDIILIVMAIWAVMFCVVFFFMGLGAFLECAAKIMGRQPRGGASCELPPFRPLGRQ